MKRVAWIAVACGLAATGVANADAEQDDLAEVIIADRIRTAFYEDAPASLQRKMRRALTAACADARQNGLKNFHEERVDVDIEQFCGVSLRYLRDVLVNGMRLEEGVICRAEDVGDFKYLPPDMLEDVSCARVEFDYENRKVTVDLSWLLVNEDP